MIIGTKKYIEKMKAENEADPIMFGDFELKLQETYVYLGDVISAQGLEASILETIAYRSGKVRGAMFETRALMQDFQMQVTKYTDTDTGVTLSSSLRARPAHPLLRLTV